MVIFFIGYSTDSSCSLFARQNFYIIVCSLTASTGFRAIESRTIQWHGINIDLIGTTAITCAPCVAAIVSRPLLTDVRAIFCRNSKTCILLRRRIFPAPTTTITVELNVVNISLIINVYDCGTVTGNGLLLNLLCSKALIIFIFAAFCSGSCLCASSARFYFDILRGILVIICIFKPMDNGILRVAAGFPLCSNGRFRRNRCNRLAICIKPTVERVTAAGGCDRAQIQRFHSELRRHVVAAVGIKCDPETGFHYRVNVCNAGFKCDGFGGIAALLGAPADNAFIFAHGELDFCGRGVQNVFADRFTGCARGGVVNHGIAVFIQEVHVAVLLKLRRNGHFLAADSRDFAEA